MQFIVIIFSIIKYNIFSSRKKVLLKSQIIASYVKQGRILTRMRPIVCKLQTT